MEVLICLIVKFPIFVVDMPQYPDYARFIASFNIKTF